jgi:hypothetical protein
MAAQTNLFRNRYWVWIAIQLVRRGFVEGLNGTTTSGTEKKFNSWRDYHNELIRLPPNFPSMKQERPVLRMLLLLLLSVGWWCCCYTSSFRLGILASATTTTTTTATTTTTTTVVRRSRRITAAFATRTAPLSCRTTTTWTQKLSPTLHAFGGVRQSYRVSPLLALRTVIEDPSNIEYLTPLQIKQLRHETHKRRARQSLSTVYWKDDKLDGNDDDITTTTASTTKLQHIARLLHTEHLVQVRGLAPNRIALVKSTAERLALEVAMERMNLVAVETAATSSEKPDDSSTTTGTNRVKNDNVSVSSIATAMQSSTTAPASHVVPTAYAPVFVVEIVGHAATLYSPPPPMIASSSSLSSSSPKDKSLNNKLTLRTTGKFNQWDKRAKALRDNRGQIIR